MGGGGVLQLLASACAAVAMATAIWDTLSAKGKILTGGLNCSDLRDKGLSFPGNKKAPMSHCETPDL